MKQFHFIVFCILILYFSLNKGWVSYQMVSTQLNLGFCCYIGGGNEQRWMGKLKRLRFKVNRHSKELLEGDQLKMMIVKGKTAMGRRIGMTTTTKK